MRRCAALRLTWPLTVASLFVGGFVVFAADPPDEKTQAAEVLKRARPVVESLKIRPASEPKDKETFQVSPDSVLKWTNPAAPSFFGNVFVWTSKGRPEVVASINDFLGAPPHRDLEFHSLSTGKVIVDRGEQTIWTPALPGLEIKPIPEGPRPAGSPVARLRQIRDLAKDFAGRRIDDMSKEVTLRFLNQPLFRYGSPDGDAIDGALFAFVEGTDPEVFLLIEARKGEGGLTWQFGLARFHRFKLQVTYKNQDVWTAPRIYWPQVIDSSQPYFNFDLQP